MTEDELVAPLGSIDACTGDPVTLGEMGRRRKRERKRKTLAAVETSVWGGWVEEGWKKAKAEARMFT